MVSLSPTNSERQGWVHSPLTSILESARGKQHEAHKVS